MTGWLVVFEDERWRGLGPLTDLVTVPSLRFGAARLAERWSDHSGRRLVGVADRHGVRIEPKLQPKPDDPVLVANAAALPSPALLAALDEIGDGVARRGDRIVAARLPYARLAGALSARAGLEGFLGALALPDHQVEARVLERPWQIVEWNAEALAADLERAPSGIAGDVHPQAVLLEPKRITVESGARIDPLAVLDARGGPIRIERQAIVLSQTVVVGPCVVGAGTQLLGGFVGRSTIGPECRIAGEVEECVWQGFANKRHHGFVGHSAIGEWVNLGALTTTSDLKNNYGNVRVWVDGREEDSGTSKVGSMIGAHVKTGIGTLLPTGAVIGTGSNLFGGGRFAPKHVPAFAWWDGERTVEHHLEAFLRTARTAMSRRSRELSADDEARLSALHRATAAQRAVPARATGATPHDAARALTPPEAHH